MREIASLEFQKVGESSSREEIEKHTLTVKGWDHEEGFRVPMVTVTEDGRCCEGAEHLRGLLNLEQGWIHDDDITTTEKFYSVLDGLEHLLVPIETLNHDPQNVRLHDERNLQAVRKSLQRFGQHHPLVVQRDNMVVRIGNARLASARALGWTHVAALVVDEDNMDAMARAIADNKTGELATWDFQGLSDQLALLQDDGWDLEFVGFEKFDSDPLLTAEWEPPTKNEEADEDASGVETNQRLRIDFTNEQWAELQAAFDRDRLEDEELQAFIVRKVGA